MAIELTDLPSFAGDKLLASNSGGTALEFVAKTVFVTPAGTETLTNKTLTSPNVSGLAITDSSIVFEGSSADANETTLTVTNPTEDRTITFPDASFTVVGRDTTDTLTNKTLTSPVVNVGSDATGDIYYRNGSGVLTRLAIGTTGQVLNVSGGGIPAWTAGAGGGDAQTANPLSQFAATTSAQLAGVMSDETGSGALVFATSPTLVTPALGTPSSGTLTNCTGLPFSAVTSVKAEIGIACSDETTAITTGTAKATFRMPYAMTLTAVRASVTTAPTGSTIIIDINESGSTILSTKLSIDASEKTSTTAASAAVISDTALADDAEITIDFDQVGSTVAGAGVKIWLIGTRT